MRVTDAEGGEQLAVLGDCVGSNLSATCWSEPMSHVLPFGRSRDNHQLAPPRPLARGTNRHAGIASGAARRCLFDVFCLVIFVRVLFCLSLFDVCDVVVVCFV